MIVAGLASTVRAVRLLLADRAALRRSGMFDAVYYRETQMAGGFPRSPALWHYLLKGRTAGASPHPLFDPHWYRAAYPDIAATGVDPAVHYAREGWREARDPNPFFAASDFRRAQGAPPMENRPALQHASKEQALPYAFLGVAAAHVVAYALIPSPPGGVTVLDCEAAAVIEAAVECIRRPQGARESALFVTHSADGRLKPRVRHYLESLAREGIATTLIVAADNGFIETDEALLSLVDGLYVRENSGWDFAAWAHVLRLAPRLLRSHILYWLNDSVVGPLEDAAFGALLQMVRNDPADVIGLTSNMVEGEHLQSYFLALRQNALRCMAFQRFVHDVRSLATKHEVIITYEVSFSPAMARAGLAVAALFPARHDDRDLTVFAWEELLERGFPFLKASLLTREEPGIDFSGVAARLSRHGFNLQRLAPSNRLPGRPAALPKVATAQERTSPKVALIGPGNYSDGLGVASRGYVSALMHTDYAWSFAATTAPLGAHARIAPSLVAANFAGAPDVAILQLDPDGWSQPYLPEQHRVLERASARIGAIVWESQKPLRDLARGATPFEEIWTPSTFCAARLRETQVATVHVVPYPVPLPPLRSDDSACARMRASLGLEPDARMILYTFDSASGLDRENPLALVRAFARSRLAARNWRLVLDAKDLTRGGVAAAGLARAAAAAKGVVLVDRSRDREARSILLDACDVYASPHASTGFGLTIAQAMARAKLVVATDFGGSVDFLDAACGFPVAWRAWTLPQDVGPYEAGTTWAQIDEDALAASLLTISELDEDTRERLGAGARARIGSQLSPAAVAARMRVRIEALLGR